METSSLALMLAFGCGMAAAGGVWLAARRMKSAAPPPRAEMARPAPATAATPQFLPLAGASHEFRTPLNGILGMAHLLAESDLDQEQMAYVDSIRAAGGALLAIVDEVLDAARIEAGHFEPVSESFDIVALVEGVAELLSPRAAEKGLAIAASIPAGMPRMVTGDPGRLRQALINLAGNAVKFTQTGSVGIYLKRSAEGGIEIAVEDTGPGIPEEERSRIFEAFQQVEGEPAAREGTGLGLSITRNIIESYKGRIEVTSRLGEGARFTVSLRWRGNGTGLRAAETADLSGKAVLIVARDDHQRRILRTHLDGAGAHVTCVDGIASATDQLGKGTPDIVLIDGGFGGQAAELAKLARVAGIIRSIILLSPAERRLMGQPKEHGFDAFLMKPVRTASLFDRILPGAAEQAPAAPQAATLSLSGKAILIAEDDPVSAHLLRRLLEKRGAAVRVAGDAASAQSLLRAERFDAAILDKILPGGLSGLAIARTIRELEAAEKREPMLLICSSADFGAAETAKALAAGCDHVLPKPVDPSRLDALLTSRPEREAAAA